MNKVIDLLSGLNRRSHESQMAEASIASQLMTEMQQQKLITRARKMADHQYEKCHGKLDYEDEDEEMRVNLITGNVVADESALAALMSSMNDKQPETGKSTGQETAGPTSSGGGAQHDPPSAPTLDVGALWAGLPMWMKAGLLSLIGLGAGAVALGVANYLKPPPEYEAVITTDLDIAAIRKSMEAVTTQTGTPPTIEGQ